MRVSPCSSVVARESPWERARGGANEDRFCWRVDLATSASRGPVHLVADADKPGAQGCGLGSLIEPNTAGGSAIARRMFDLVIL